MACCEVIIPQQQSFQGLDSISTDTLIEYRQKIERNKACNNAFKPQRVSMTTPKHVVAKALITMATCCFSCRQVMRQLLEAVEYIHSKSIVHRDLKVKDKFISRFLFNLY